MSPTATPKPSNPDAPGCGILARCPVLSVLAFAIVGIVLGVLLSYAEFQNKSAVLRWLGLVGDLFVRSLQAIVLPLVFVHVIISVVDMMTVGKAGSIGLTIIGLYMLTTVCAASLGILSTLSMKGLYNRLEASEPIGVPSFIQLGCMQEGAFITEGDNGWLSCAVGGEEKSKFVIEDLSGIFTTQSSGQASLSDTVYDGVFEKLVSSNIVRSFAEGDFAAVVFFAIVFSVAFSRVLVKQGNAGIDASVIISFLKELDQGLVTLINWVIAITPFAVLSLIVQAVGDQDDLAAAFENVGYLVLATMIAMGLHVVLVYFGVFFLITRANPITFLRKLVPAQTMAFACSSSAATIPMTLKSVKSTGLVPDQIARFVVPLGAALSSDGGAIYLPCACIWLAILNGADLTVGSYILLGIMSTLGSVGTAPVPSGSLVLIITVYNAVFGTAGTPDGFSFILAIDWFVDRLRTTVSVTGDAVVAGLVSHLCLIIEDSNDETSEMEDEEATAPITPLEDLYGEEFEV